MLVLNCVSVGCCTKAMKSGSFGATVTTGSEPGARNGPVAKSLPSHESVVQVLGPATVSVAVTFTLIASPGARAFVGFGVWSPSAFSDTTPFEMEPLQVLVPGGNTTTVPVCDDPLGSVICAEPSLAVLGDPSFVIVTVYTC